jgi:Tfp pilus assembly protein PilZ
MHVQFGKLIQLFFLLTLAIDLHVHAQGHAQEYVEGELIVKTKTKMLPQVQKGFMGKMSNKGMTLKATFNKLQMHQMKLAPGKDLKATIRELQQDPDVEFAEPNYILRKSEIPSTAIQPMSYEEMVGTVAALSNGSYSQSGAQVGVNDAWGEMSVDSSDVPIVAVLDTGVDYNHNVFTQSHGLWNNPDELPDNGLDDDGNGYVDDIMGWNFFSGHNKPWDDDGHGSHVSGIIVGTSIDIYESPIRQAKVQVMPLKFLGADGSGDTADAVRGIDYAITKGARVINASWGGASYSRALHEAFGRAYASGLFIVTAAGNFGTNNDSSPIYPANLTLPGLISVAASNNWDGLASFSNFGVQTVHIAAPGVTIGSTYPRNLYGYSSGTSMAAPFVAGVGAMLLREAPKLTGFQIKELILNTAKASVNFSQKIYTSGRVSFIDALRAAKKIAGSEGLLPTYSMGTPERAIASEGGGGSEESSSGVAGCGTVSMVKAFYNGDGPSGADAIPILILFMLPLVLWALLRRGSEHQAAEVSAFDLRFAKRLDVADTVLVKTRQGNFEASLKNISKGGLAFAFQGKRVDVDEQVCFVFSSKDGKEQVEVAGRIVWTNEASIAGVQFHMVSRYVQNFLLRSYA